MIRLVYIALFGLCLVGSFASCEKKPVTFSKDELFIPTEDEVFEQLKDSLEFYFGRLEIDLIRNFRENMKSMKSDEEFHRFFRNSRILKASLISSLNHHAKDMHEGVHEMDWFNGLLGGLAVKPTKDRSQYDIFYNYDSLTACAKRTQGGEDDEFVKLLRVYDLDHPTAIKWLTKIEDEKYCSELGDGIHLGTLKQIDVVLDSGKTFQQELHKMRVTIITDILFNKHYCNAKAQVEEEIGHIIKEVKLKKSERTFLENRMEELKGPDENQVEFLER